MAASTRYLVIRFAHGLRPGPVVLLPSTSLSREEHVAWAHRCLESARHLTGEGYRAAERLALLLREHIEPLVLTVQSEHPSLSAAGLEALREVLLRRGVRNAIALELTVIIGATLLAEQQVATPAGQAAPLEPDWDHLFRLRKHAKDLLAASIHLNHAWAAYCISVEVGLPWTNPASTPTSIGEDSVSLGEIVSEDIFMNVMSNAPYHAVREALALNRFSRSGDSPWPTASIERGGARGQAQLFPIEAELQPYMDSGDQKNLINSMWQQRAELSDLDADVLDMMSAMWLDQARNSESTARARIDDLLRLRGLKPKTGEGGRNSGYRKEQREQLFRTLTHLNNLWVKMAEFETVSSEGDRRGRKTKIQNISSRAFIITDIGGNQRGSDGPMEIEEFLFRPGMIFANFLYGVGRQTALLSRKAVEYDPYRQSWEKRLTRYLSWQWRVEATRPDSERNFRVETLLDAVGETWNRQDGRRQKERLEKALKQLAIDHVIASWAWNEPENPARIRRFMSEYWQHASIRIRQPDQVRNHYQTLMPLPAPAVGLPPQQVDLLEATGRTSTLADRMLAKRKKAGLSQQGIASLFRITQAYYSQVESGKREPSTELRRRMEDWLDAPV